MVGSRRGTLTVSVGGSHGELRPPQGQRLWTFHKEHVVSAGSPGRALFSCKVARAALAAVGLPI
eukprot:11220180-Lingulodinium_polyedra.AAC.1